MPRHSWYSCLPNGLVETGKTREVFDKFLRLGLEHPCPSFPGFFGKGTENHQKNQGFFIPTDPLKSLENKGKTLKKTRNSLQGKKNKEFPKNKERKDRDTTQKMFWVVQGRTSKRPHQGTHQSYFDGICASCEMPSCMQPSPRIQ